MTDTPCITDADMANGVKGAFHGGLATLAGIFGVYNYSAWLAERRAKKQNARRRRHLFWNWVFYLALVIFEGYQIGRHAGRP